MTRPAKLLLIIVVAGLALIQLVRPDRAVLPVDPAQSVEAALVVSPEVKAILVRSCYDCHSRETRWPWYSSVSPVGWLIANDVAEGRRQLDFSTWTQYPADRAARKLDDIVEEVSARGMPMPIYTYMHRDAALSDAQIKLLVYWAQGQKRHLGGQTGATTR